MMSGQEILRLLLKERAQLEVSSSIPKNQRPPDIHHFVETHGRPFEAHPLPPAFDLAEPNSCFLNALELAISNSLIYVEGFAANHPEALYGIFHHAWCVDKQHRVIDNTWQKSSDSIYFGIPIVAELAKSIVHDAGRYRGVLVDISAAPQRYPDFIAKI